MISRLPRVQITNPGLNLLICSLFMRFTGELVFLMLTPSFGSALQFTSFHGHPSRRFRGPKAADGIAQKWWKIYWLLDSPMALIHCYPQLLYFSHWFIYSLTHHIFTCERLCMFWAWGMIPVQSHTSRILGCYWSQGVTMTHWDFELSLGGSQMLE